MLNYILTSNISLSHKNFAVLLYFSPTHKSTAKTASWIFNSQNSVIIEANWKIPIQALGQALNPLQKGAADESVNISSGHLNIVLAKVLLCGKSVFSCFEFCLHSQKHRGINVETFISVPRLDVKSH